ncbi:MAG: HD domain-containing protein [Actinobacteria bacterium]|nr:HD domain-containing protein [Actinomycetota bacterium]
MPALTQDYRTLGWWVGPFLEVLGILVVATPVALDLLRASPSRLLTGDLRGAELVTAEETFLGCQVGALTRLLAEKDEYTEGQTRRVALLAVQVGEELGVPPMRLRELAMGGLLHDIGKLSVPDEILQKPGALDDEELRSCSAIRSAARPSCASSASRAASAGSSATITSGSAAATRPASPPARSRSRPGF